MGLRPELSEPRLRPKHLDHPDRLADPNPARPAGRRTAADPPLLLQRTVTGNRTRPSAQQVSEIAVAAPGTAGEGVSAIAVASHGEARQLPADTRAVRLGRLPDPRPLAGELAQAVVEVLAGDRPAVQLLTRFDNETYGQLSARAPDPVTAPTLGPGRAGIHPHDRPRVCTVHVSRPADGVAEVTARVQTNGRSRAVALRLEEWQGRWRCSALDVG